MLITTLMLIGFGLLTVYSADDRDLSIRGVVYKQILFVVVGLILMGTLAAIDYRLLQSLALPMYGVGIVLLTVVLHPQLGETITGARRWFNLGPMTFQPSEPAKLATIVSLATFIASRGVQMRRLVNLVLTVPIVAVPFYLVFIEPDLGTALAFLAIWGGMIAVSRTRVLYLLGMGIAAVPAGYIAWHFILHDYQKDRVYTFLNPEADPLARGFNIIQARITIGQAGLLGHRFADSAQANQSQLLAVRTSDFAFAHAAGNFGFVGGVALFVLFLLLIWRYLRVAELARDEFGQLLAIGAAALLFFQAFVNIGMNVGLLPPVGIPLPFISAGGVAMVTMLAMQGILQSVLMHREKLTFDPH